MASKLFLRNTANNAIGNYFDMVATAGSASDTGVVNTAASGTEIQWTRTAVGTVLEFISGRVPAGGFTLAGTMTFSIWAHESNMNANCGARSRVFKRSAGVDTEVGGGPYSDGVEFGTAAAEMTWTGTPTSTAFAEDDRIIVKYYITNIGTMGGGFTCTLTYNAADAATGDSFFQINETVTFKAEPLAYTLVAGSGSFALTGTAAGLLRGLKLVAASGSYALAGTAAALAKGFKVAAESGSFALTGTTTTLLRSLKLVAAGGSYTQTGTAASLLRGLKISAAGGNYTYTGTTVTLTKGGGAALNYTLVAAAGAYALAWTGPWTWLSPTSPTWTPLPDGAAGGWA